MSSTWDESHVTDNGLLTLAAYLEEHADEIVQRAERAWESNILLFSQLTDSQRDQIRELARQTIYIWAIRLRQSPDYARRVYELGHRWGEQASQWQLHIYSFTKALDLLTHAAWEFLAETFPMENLQAQTVFFLGRSRDQIIDDLRIPLFSTFMSQREVEMEDARFSLQGPLSLPGRSLLQELANRLRDNLDRVIPAWIESVHQAPGATATMQELLERRGGTLVSLLLSLLQSPTPETGAMSISNVRAIGLESAQAGISFQEMFHALQLVRPILWDTVYEIYRREQYWHPAEFIEVLARLHLLLDLFSEGVGQAYLQQKEMIIQEQAEEIRRRDLNLAREILESLLPNKRLTLPHTDIGSVWIPAREIGGDFYDIFSLGDGDVMFIIGDVSGKGISAALLVSMVKYVIKANAPLHASPATLLMTANRLFYQDMGPEMFVTMFVARYTPKTGKLIYSSAGHDPCYLCHVNHEPHLTTLSSQGPILGIFPDIEITDCQVTMHPNDVLLLYTDGLVNVRCEGRHPVNSRRLCGFIREHADLPAQQLVQELLNHTIQNCEPTDDITLLLAKREAEEEPQQ